MTTIDSTPAGQEDALRAARWIGILQLGFPELLTELAPGRRTGPGLSRNRSGSGAGSAPVRIHVSDALRDITDGVVELEEAVWERLGLGRPTRASVPERLRRIDTLLDRVAGNPLLARHVLDECRRMARRCSRTLGTPETFVRVDGRCPWCDSVSLRALPAARAVICVNPGCRCSDPACDCHGSAGHRHEWAESRWDDLAAAGVDVHTLSGLADDVRTAREAAGHDGTAPGARGRGGR
ncbi:hypothetical protein [Streptomyces sp. NPDC008150]|uniref:hypothetical protein n=1 Tax=Streptomyces sp. NPDC008150 TaxID=3364816 RepID=UPI0036EBB56B